MITTILRILLLLAEWLARKGRNDEYERREVEREKLREDPVGWANNHFCGRLQPDAEEECTADKTGNNSEKK